LTIEGGGENGGGDHRKVQAAVKMGHTQNP